MSGRSSWSQRPPVRLTERQALDLTAVVNANFVLNKVRGNWPTGYPFRAQVYRDAAQIVQGIATLGSALEKALAVFLNHRERFRLAAGYPATLLFWTPLPGVTA